MTRDQLEDELRKEFAVNERLSTLVIEYGKLFADTALRASYASNDAAFLIRQAGMAEGVEKFVKTITVSPRDAKPNRHD